MEIADDTVDTKGHCKHGMQPRSSTFAMPDLSDAAWDSHGNFDGCPGRCLGVNQCKVLCIYLCQVLMYKYIRYQIYKKHEKMLIHSKVFKLSSIGWPSLGKDCQSFTTSMEGMPSANSSGGTVVIAMINHRLPQTLTFRSPHQCHKSTTFFW